MVFDDYDRAAAECAPDQMVCGTYLKDGTPQYFVMPADAGDENVREVAFRVREGRDISTYERWLISQVDPILNGSMA
jgi:hypothetical protein